MANLDEITVATSAGSITFPREFFFGKVPDGMDPTFFAILKSSFPDDEVKPEPYISRVYHSLEDFLRDSAGWLPSQ